MSFSKPRFSATKPKPEWFNDQCAESKTNFKIKQRQYQNNMSQINRNLMNKARRRYNGVRRKTKRMYAEREKASIANLAK